MATTAGLTADVSTAYRAIDSAKSAIGDGIASALIRIGNEQIGGAKQVVPVYTGNLRDSISVLTSDLDSIEVGTDVEYGPFVEFGTFKQEAQPYLGPQADAMQSRAPAILSQEISSKMRSGGR